MLLSYLFLKLNRENLCLFYFFIPSHLSSIFVLYHYLLFVLFISFLSFCSLTVFSLNSPNFLFVSFPFLSLYLQHSQAIVLKADPWKDEDSQLFFLIRSSSVWLVLFCHPSFLFSLVSLSPSTTCTVFFQLCSLLVSSSLRFTCRASCALSLLGALSDLLHLLSQQVQSLHAGFYSSFLFSVTLLVFSFKLLLELAHLSLPVQWEANLLLHSFFFFLQWFDLIYGSVQGFFEPLHSSVFDPWLESAGADIHLFS